MLDVNTPRLNKLPFFFADTVLLAAAVTLVVFGARPLRGWEMLTVTACAALGGWLAVLPYLKEYAAALRHQETRQLGETTAKLNQLDVVADRIENATSQWQTVQEQAGKTADLARGVVERLTKEATALADTVSRSADSEKQTLKLEAAKLRRAEGEWLQAVGRVMDHVFALHLAAIRSGQPTVKEQMDRFHGACRDALRRVGFVSLVAAPDEPFDPKKHQAANGAPVGEDARVDETVAPGFLYQGHLLRQVMVTLVGSGGASARSPDSAPGESPPASTEHFEALEVSEPEIKPTGGA